MRWLFALFLFVANAGFAQSSGDSAVVAGALLLPHMILGDVKDYPAIAEDQIQGICEFNFGQCSGAILILRDQNQKIVDRITITGRDGFTFSNLKSGKYTIEVQYARIEVVQKIFEVRTGQHAHINLKDLKSRSSDQTSP